MTTTHDIERRLAQALSFQPSADDLGWLDQRVAQIAAGPIVARRGTPRLRLFLRPLAVVAAFVMLTGAVAAALGLLDRIVESSGQPGWHVAWDNAERLDLSVTDAGVTINVERAYADINQVLIGFTVAGLEAPTSPNGPAPFEWRVDIEDPAGQSAELWATSSSGMGMDETGLSAVVQTWEGSVAPDAGTWVLTFTSVGYQGGGFVPGQCDVGSTLPECVNPPPSDMVDGTWRFEFELPKPAGLVIRTGSSVSVDESTLSLPELRLSPTMVSATLGVRVADRTILRWSGTKGLVRHDGTSYPFQSSTHLTQDPTHQGEQGDLNQLMTVAGSGSMSGTWEVEFAKISYWTTEGEEFLPGGPWTLAITVP